MTRYTLKRPQRQPTRLDLASLNPQQREVVTSPTGYSLVIAGAGSGKTKTLTHRAAYLIDRGLDPRRILLCTFTNRAAREMTRRVGELLNIELRSLWAGTFHHVANLALRRHGVDCGLRENYAIIDREDARDLMASCLADEGKRLQKRRYPNPAVLLEIASQIVNTRRSLTMVLQTQLPRFYDLEDEIAGIIRRFEGRKRSLGLLDYDDLLVYFHRLLIAPTGQELIDRFEYVLVDEYQDTNQIQGEIVELCAAKHQNLMVVGDDAQSIYSFRGANFQNIIEFPSRHPQTQVYRLEYNYRSTPQILELANRSIQVNLRQHPKVLRPTRPPGVMPALIPLADGGQQAAFVAQRILELHHDLGLPLAELGVLYRAHSHCLELQIELNRRRIPYSIRSGLRFFEQAHIKDVVAYLRILHNGVDQLAWRRVLRQQHGIGERTAKQILDRIGETPALCAEVLPKVSPSLATRSRKPVDRLAQVLVALTQHGSPSEAIKLIVEHVYRDYAQANFPNADTRIEDLMQLADYARRYDGVETFLSELALAEGLKAEAVGDGDAPDDKVTLSTIHQAKGLEWRAVWILWLVEGRFPQALAAKTAGELEEERRLFYVAATRAKDELYLCYPRFSDEADGPDRLFRLSRFVAELGDAGQPPYERWAIEEEAEDTDAR
ncbi:MAG: ATP-dependent helicase [Deltaproteobacteria bacterium]|nr:ATP-dependent helicase [Deltaproteobacteria bacterium]